MASKTYVCEQYPFHSMGGVRRWGKDLCFNRGLLTTDNEEQQKIVESDSFFIAGLIKISQDGTATKAPIVNSHLGMVSAKPFTDEAKEHAVTGNPKPKAQPAKAEEIELEAPTMRELYAMPKAELEAYAKEAGAELTGNETKDKLRDLIIENTGR